MSLSDRYRERLQQMIIALGGTVPGRPSPTDEENYTLQLLDALALRLSGSQQKLVTFRGRATADCTNVPFFIADRSYRVVRLDYVHTTAETTSTELYTGLAIATGSTAPGAAVGVNHVVFDCRAAANVVQTRLASVITFGDLVAGDRLCMRFVSGTPTQLAGVVCVVTLEPI